MYKYCFVLFLLLVNCKSRINNCIVKVNVFLKRNANKVYVIDEFGKNKLIIRDKGIDSVKGGEYLFDNGVLKSYKFFQTMNAYTYNEEYDDNGRSFRTEGEPLVDTKIREVNKDSAFFSFSFFSLNKTYRTLFITNNSGDKFSLQLKDDSLYSNMYIGSFGLSTRGLSRFSLYLGVEYSDNCESDVKFLKDTVFLVKDSILNFEKR